MAQRFTAAANYLEATGNYPDANSDYTCMAWVRVNDSPSGTSALVWDLGHFTFGATNQDDVGIYDFGFGLAIIATFATAGVGSISPTAGGLSDDTWMHVATVRDGTTCRLYIDGSLAADGTQDNSSRAATERFEVCASDPGGSANEIDLEGMKFFQRALTAEQITVEMDRTMPVGPDATHAWPFIHASNGRDYLGLSPLTMTGTLAASDPVGVQFRAASTDTLVWPPVAGGGAVTGTSACTLPMLTSSATGAAAHTGTSAFSLPMLTAAATGIASTAITGTSACTLPMLTSSAAGAAAHTGTSAFSLPMATSEATGIASTAITGTSACTLPMLTSTASGAVSGEVTGTAAFALPVLTAAATGTAVTDITGTSACTLPMLTSTASGAVSGEATGTAAFTLPLIVTTAGEESEGTLGAVESATTIAYELRLTDGTTVYASTESIFDTSVMHTTSMTVTAIIEVFEPVTISAQVAASKAVAAAMLASTSFNPSGKTATTLSATRIR